MTGSDAPSNITALRARISNQAKSTLQENQLSRLIAQVVLAQMLPQSAIKGGSAMKMRFGISDSRFSKDLDVARRDDFKEFIDELETRLQAGWAGFTGRVRQSRNISKPIGVPKSYIMQAFDIKLAYQGKDFMTIPLEVGHDELNDTDEPEYVLSADVVTLFEFIGLPVPGPMALVAPDHQIAQKLHALSEPGSERAHDLVDLQLLVSKYKGQDKAVGDLCQRLFKSRKAHAWPPLVEVQSNWPALYDAAREGLEVLPDVNMAVEWVNLYIQGLTPVNKQTDEA